MMSAFQHVRRALAGLSGVLLLTGFMVWSVAAAPTAVAATPSINIGVDNATPSPCAAMPTGTRPPVCHNFIYDSFFPSFPLGAPPITVHAGDVVSFSQNANSPDALHTATLIGATDTVGDAVTATFNALNALPLGIPDVDGGEPTQGQLNSAILNPTNPACGNSADNPCPYDGTSMVNSGALFPGSPPVYYKINVTNTATPAVPYRCFIHPGMFGVILVVPTATATSTQADLDSLATAQYATMTADALAAETAANTAGASHTTNPNGTTNWNLLAGVNGANGDAAVQVLEMLPSTLTIKPGDTVTWANNTFEPHTVTFPHSEGLTVGSDYDFAPVRCEGATADTLPSGPPPTFGCTGPPEFHLNPGPKGPTGIANPVTQATSGALFQFPLGPGAPVVTSTTFTFANANSFSYMCTVHDHMAGVINVVGAPGYRELAADGGVFSFGTSGFFGSTGSIKLNKPIVGGAATPSGKGYWAVATDGGVFAFGDALFFGSTGGIKLNKPIVGIAPTPDGGGYFLFATDGGVFAFGDAKFAGSAGSITLNKPVVAGASTPDGLGYTLVASDGGIFSYGDAEFHGSAGSIKLNKPVVGMAASPSGGGYFLVATDGGIFTYGDATFFGSTGAITLNKPIVGMGATIDGLGYTLVASDGGVFNYGNSVFIGSQGGSPLNSPVVGLLR
jgi:plastocyanin